MANNNNNTMEVTARIPEIIVIPNRLKHQDSNIDDDSLLENCCAQTTNVQIAHQTWQRHQPQQQRRAITPPASASRPTIIRTIQRQNTERSLAVNSNNVTDLLPQRRPTLILANSDNNNNNNNINNNFSKARRRLSMGDKPRMPSFEIAEAPDEAAMKKQRRRRQVDVAIPLGIVGGMTLGPLGAAAGAFGGAMVTHKIHKARDERIISRYQQRVAKLETLPAKTGVMV